MGLARELFRINDLNNLCVYCSIRLKFRGLVDIIYWLCMYMSKSESFIFIRRFQIEIKNEFSDLQGR